MPRRYPCVRQSDHSDCGAAALATIALYYRRPLSLQQLRDLTGTDRRGTSLLGLLHAAERLHFTAKGIKGDAATLAQIPLPAVAHVQTPEGLGHFVVLYRVTAKTVVVADPAHGVQTLAHDLFCKSWTGYLLLLVPEPLNSATASQRAPVPPWRRLLGLLQGHTPILLEACLCALLMTILGIATSYFIQHLVDSVLVRREERLLNALGIGMGLVIAFRTVFGLLRQYLVAHVSRKVDLMLIAGYARHLLHLPLPYFEMRRAGDILARVNDITKIREAISGTTLSAVVDGTLVLLLSVVLWLYDTPLALVATAFFPLLIFSALLHHPAVRRHAREAMEHTAQLSAHLVENITGIETIKAFGAERLRMDEGEAGLVSVVQSIFALEKLGLSMQAMGTCLTACAGLVVLWYGGYRVMQGALSVGQLLFFYALLGYLMGPLERLAMVNLKLQDALVAVDRLYQVLDLEGEAPGDHRKAIFPGVRQAITLQGISLRYGQRPAVLEQVSLSIPAGHTVAIVGASGSGKSSLLKLLMGFYTPTEGRILFDGVDMQNYSLVSLRSRMRLVAQEPFIFNGTLRENIALGCPGAPFEAIVAAARAADLETFILQLPERYETRIGERGANLSGGQRQRLAIARVLVQEPEIVIFDEATSHLDTATERVIQGSLSTVLAGKTVIMVAHRLSTVKDADVIYVLQHGHIAQKGSHKQLLEHEGLYRTLWRSQTDESSHVRLPERTVVTTNGAGLNGHAALEGGHYASS